MVTNVTRFQSAVNFILNRILFYYYLSQIFELCHIFERSVCILCPDFYYSHDETPTYILCLMKNIPSDVTKHCVRMVMARYWFIS
jgi:hypothetical protein